MKARTFILLVGIALALGGLILGVVPHEAKAYGKTFTCGTAFNSDDKEAIHLDSVEYLVGSYRIGNKPTTAQDACADAGLSPFVPWSMLILGVVVAIGAAVIREPTASP